MSNLSTRPGDVPAPEPDRAYPVARPVGDDTDPRFTFGLMLDVGRVLEEHGYPPVRGGLDHVELQQALFRFIYGRATSAR